MGGGRRRLGREKQMKRDRKYSWAETGKMDSGETAGRGALPGWLLPSAWWRPSPFLPGTTPSLY